MDARGVINYPAKPLNTPETVYIVCPGKVDPALYDRIPDDAFVLATNLAITIPEVHKVRWSIAAWVVSDPDCCRKKWFKAADRSSNCIKIFSVDAAHIAGSFQKNSHGKHFSFEPGRVWLPTDKTLGDRKFLRGGTVAGAALWVATYTGLTEEIIGIGWNMSMDDYHDETSNYDARHGETWPSAKCLDAKIELKQNQGVRVCTLSDTKLKRPERI